MPELPDVARFKQHVDATAIGRRVAHTHVRDDRILADLTSGSLVRHLTGHRLAASRQHGKYLGIAIDETGTDATHVVLHFGMTGDVESFQQASDEPQRAALTLDLDDGSHLSFTCQRMFCRVRLAGGFEEFVQDRGLGPDALSPDFELRDFLRALEKKSSTVKGALMDQSVLAGIGNEYADEILFQARIHPATPVPALDQEARKRIWRRLRKVLDKAARLQGDVERMPRGWLQKVRGGDAPCPRCGTPLRKDEVAGRTTWFCPKRQPEP